MELVNCKYEIGFIFYPCRNYILKTRILKGGISDEGNSFGQPA